MYYTADPSLNKSAEVAENTLVARANGSETLSAKNSWFMSIVVGTPSNSAAMSAQVNVYAVYLRPRGQAHSITCLDILQFQEID